MADHTPGPWKAFDDEVVGGSAADVPVANVERCGWIDSTERQSNIRLICAAPDLLEALREAFETLRYLDDRGEGRDGWQSEKRLDLVAKMDRAIAKAEGR